MQTSLTVAQESGRADLTDSYSLDQRIGEGHYRLVYRYGNLALKVLMPYRTKDYGLFCINFPTSLYATLKFLVTDLSIAEYDNYSKLISQVPQEIRDSFAIIFGVTPFKEGSISLCELVLNADGSLPKSLNQYGVVESSGFWMRMDNIEDFFLSRGIPNFNINGDNILVKELGDGNYIPVLIDYKRMGTRAYPLQLHLFLKSESAKRVKRKFSAIREKYAPKILSGTLQAHWLSQSP